MTDQTTTTLVEQLTTHLRAYRTINTARHDSDAWYKAASEYLAEHLPVPASGKEYLAGELEVLLRDAEAANTVEKHGSLHWVSFHAEHLAARLAAGPADGVGDDERAAQVRDATHTADLLRALHTADLLRSGSETELPAATPLPEMEFVALADEVARLSALLEETGEQGSDEQDLDADYPTPSDILDQVKNENGRMRAHIADQERTIDAQSNALSAIATLVGGVNDMTASISNVIASTRR